MAIKQRLLNRMSFLINYVHSLTVTVDTVDLNNLVTEFTNIRHSYKYALPQKIFPKYAKICDDLLLNLQDHIKNNENVSQNSLSVVEELLQLTIDKTTSEQYFKKEIFFLPYQASMWDSFESVWKAAFNDKERALAYVMPIPYADRNPDGSPAAWHCDNDKFPKYVPILDWTKINLKEIHPDVIFFHNAYDNLNLVTSVESRFYSHNLKEWTDKLIYIPYSVEDEIQPGNEIREEAIAHRALVPGVMNADLVIAQSEDTREAWINILTRHTNVNDRAYWEKRILGLGSPKIDKVLSDKKEDFELPEDWKKLIKGKKVILYITSIGPTLQNADKVSDKLRRVFDTFRPRDDVVLWWRPHPLMKSTFHSMKPQFEEEYLSLVKRYVEEGFGIYDESPDMHRAICYSDAYYGDRSSVETLYKKCGKPIMWQQFGFEYEYISYRLSAVFMDDDFIYLTSNTHRGALLCKLNRQNGDVTVKILRDNNGKNFHTSVLSVAAFNSLLLLCPYRGKNFREFIIYDLLSDEYTTLHVDGLEDKISDAEFQQWFRFPVTYKDKIFVGAWSFPIVASVDLDKRKVRLIEGFDKKFLKNRRNSYKRSGWHRSCIASGHFYSIHYDRNEVLDVDLETESICGIKKIGDRNLRFHLIATDGNIIWLGTVDGIIVKYNPADESTFIYPEKMLTVNNQVCFGNGFMLYHDNSLYMLCSLENEERMCLRVKFDTLSGVFSEVEYLDKVGRLNDIVPTGSGRFLLSSKYKGTNKVFLLDSLSASFPFWREYTLRFSDDQKNAIKSAILEDYFDDIGKESIAEGENGIELDDFIQVALNYEKKTAVNAATNNELSYMSIYKKLF